MGRLGWAFVAVSLLAYGQRQMSVPDLVTFIKSSVQLKNDDRAVADTVRRIKLTNRLDASTVEDLQGMGTSPTRSRSSSATSTARKTTKSRW